jgi:hypothetical protein
MFYEFPLRTQSALNLREHWRVRAKRVKAERIAAFTYTPAWVRSQLPVVIRLVRIAPRELDTDNLAASFKGVRDGIADRLGIDDRDDRVHWHYAQQRGKPKEYAVRVEVTQR